MQVHATGEFSSAIVVDADSLQRLWNHVDAFAAPASATISCSDGIERKFDTLEKLLKYEDPARASIRTVELYGRTRNPERSITITVGRPYGARAAASIRGEEDDASTMKARIMDTFSGMCAWYSPAATMDLYIVWMVVFVTIMLVLQLMAPSETPPRPGRSFSEAVRVLAYVVPIIGSIVLIVFGIAKLRARYFPLVSFVLGQGVRRHQVNEQVRWTVIVGFFVGLAASIVYAVLSRT